MSEKLNDCEPESSQSCSSCGPSCGSGSIEEVVKERYGRLWESQRGGSVRSKKASLPSAHDALLKELNPRTGMKVLDIGSGSGETILRIAEKVGPTGKAVGIDFSPQAIALAKEKAKRRKLEKVTEFRQGNAKELPFSDNTFDAVISECVVCLISDKQRTLNEKVRVLKPGGHVIMHDAVSLAPMPKIVREDQRLYCACIGGAVNRDEYVRMMKEAGLKDVKVVDFSKEGRKMMNASILAQAIELRREEEFAEIVNFVRNGGVGYALFIGTKEQV